VDRGGDEAGECDGGGARCVPFPPMQPATSEPTDDLTAPAEPLAVPGADVAVVRSPADRRMRRILRLPVDGPKTSIFDAQNAFSRSIAISAARCLLTYVFLPVLRPVVDLSGGAGPALGILLSVVSVVAIVAATRRFFAADHTWRWTYLCVGGAIAAWLVVQAGLDLADLLD
jgi:hypothetical protein